MLEQVQDACEDALSLSGGSLVLVVLGTVGRRSRSSLARAARAGCATSARSSSCSPASDAERSWPAVRTTVLDEGDPLRQDAAVVLLSPERALALHARQGADGGWTCRRTTDPQEVGESARMLLTRAAAVERDPVLALG